MRLFHRSSLQQGRAGLNLLTFLSLLIVQVTANWKYKSRPDLSPPTLNITTSITNEVSPGYIFVAPYSWLPWSHPIAHGPLQPAPYIFTTTGELVWSGFGYFGGWTTNFQAAKWNGKDIIFAFEGSRNAPHGHSHGYAKILDNNYETIREIRGGNHELLDLHEFHIVDERTALVEVYHPLPYDLQRYGLKPNSQWIIDIKTGRLLFEWKSLDHVSPEETVISIAALKFGTGHNSSDAIDYFHINSVDRDSENNYLISGRHTSTLYKINGTSGGIIWRLGGKYSNFTLESGVEFSLQHHARYISKSTDGNTEIISLFDNSGARISGETGKFEDKSSGKILLLNHDTWTATLLQSFAAPQGIFAFSQGSTQILPNGNAFINWGSGGAITEFSSNGSVLFHAYLESGDLWENGDIQNYRAFKFNWTGIPNEDLAVAASTSGESTVVYVSWNGDTETKLWRFYGINSQGNKLFLGEEKKTGFETQLQVTDKSRNRFLVEAVGDDGRVLGASAVVNIQEDVYKYDPGRYGSLKQTNSQVLLSRDKI
ncbi:ASST-domain-containing protein [Xylogone sp. PMI_703]|nr:ASST-domain-containing protein [Xylogone sp. PMI_703]